MSYSDPKITNPVTKFIEFKGSNGTFTYWDPEKGDNGENVEVQKPFFIIPLDDVHTIGGFNDDKQAGFYANQVRDIRNDILSVRCKRDLIKEGLYEEVKSITGVRYQKNLYALLVKDENSKPELVCFKVLGSFLNAYIDLKVEIGKHAVQVTENLDKGKKGSNEYYIPILKRYKVTKQWHPKALEADKQLQPYLLEATKKRRVEETPKPTQNTPQQANQMYNETFHGQGATNQQSWTDGMLGDDDDDLPF